MLSSKRILSAAVILLSLALGAQAQVTFINSEKEKPAASFVAQAPVQYSIGDPTDDEQMHLELINRARADANAEALRLIALSFTNPDVAQQFDSWNVDTNLMKAQFATNPPAGPLSFNAKLIAAARAHSQFQFDTADQTHTGSGGSNLGQRVTAAGYAWSRIGENVFTNSISAEQGHAAFEVDWGPGPGGMQTALGHRASIHNRAFTEVGIGIVEGYNVANGRGVGPQVITEDFARPLTPTTFVTGVAYYDINGNNFYDIGEGLPGVRVTVDSPNLSQAFAVTTTSGGYSIPVPSNAAYTVRFNVTGASEVTATAAVTTNNAKVDFKPAYIVPNALSGPTTLYAGLASTYTLPPLPGATGYRARLLQVVPLFEGAEGPLTNVTVTSRGGNSGVSTFSKASGAASFHLAQVADQVLDGNYAHIVEFKNPIYVDDNARIEFKSRMAIAAVDEFGAVEVSDDNGETWKTIWTQFGADQPGELVFSAKTASLADYAGKLIRVRFVYDLLPGDQRPYYGFAPSDPTFNLIGWYFDDISFVNAKSAVNAAESPISATPTVNVTPRNAGDFILQFQDISGQRNFAYGPAREVTVLPAPPVFEVDILNITATTVELLINSSSGSASMFAIESAPAVTGPWSRENATVVSGGGFFKATVPRSGDIRFYRAVTP
jgi:uncharacterized protein YkwD